MSGKQLKPDSTPVILKNLAIVIPAFYASYYAIAAIFSAIAGITMDGTFLLSTGAEMSCYYLRDMRSIKVDHE
eukprot:g8440.t1